MKQNFKLFVPLICNCKMIVNSKFIWITLLKWWIWVFFASLSKPGLWLQNITTQEPTDEQVKVSIVALQSAFNHDIEQFVGQKFQADAI